MYSLCSCNQLHFHSSNGNLQNQNNNQDQQNTENQTFTYVYSVTQEVLHLPDCYHINFINPKFRVTYTGDISVLFAQGFTVCKDCFASDEEKEKKVDVSRAGCVHFSFYLESFFFYFVLLTTSCVCTLMAFMPAMEGCPCCFSMSFKVMTGTL